ncbi:MAG: hypothetical protein KME21_07680 [Desmonostoc vinosum HA7617-LM4]|jgi:hypothetical protein|nr:hypothetical protein [Desmonostoc vinosum HA7617-LM4]
MTNSNSDKIKKSDYLTDLSTAEEEKINGGFEGFFLQQTAIDSFAEDQTRLSNGNGLNLSSNSRTGYSFRQFTLAFTSSSSRRRGRRGGSNPMAFLFQFLRGFGF